MKLRLFQSLAAAALLACIQAGPARALETVTFVTGTGSDASACTRAAPCKTFAGAIAKTVAGGDIIALEPGEYGLTVINKSITITAAEGAGVVRGNGFFITGANNLVTLSGLTFDGVATAEFGVRVFSGARLLFRDCVFQNYTNPNANVGVALAIDTTTTIKILVQNCAFLGNKVGIRVMPSGASAVLTLNDKRIDKSSLFGVQADGAAAVVLANKTTVTNNATGVGVLNNAKFFSFGNNSIGGNTASAVPTLIPLQ